MISAHGPSPSYPHTNFHPVFLAKSDPSGKSRPAPDFVPTQILRIHPEYRWNLHAQLSPDAQPRLEEQKRNSVITSVVISMPVFALAVLVLLFILLLTYLGHCEDLPKEVNLLTCSSHIIAETQA